MVSIPQAVGTVATTLVSPVGEFISFQYRKR